MSETKTVLTFILVLALLVFLAVDLVTTSTSLPLRVALNQCADFGVSVSYQMHWGISEVQTDCQIVSVAHILISDVDQLCIKRDGVVNCYFMGSVPDSVVP